MEQQCRSTGGRYGIELDAALITEIDPPPEVDRALSAINSTRNQVAADISTARADAEQQITMSKRAVEIATNNAQAEVAPLRELATRSPDQGGGRLGSAQGVSAQHARAAARARARIVSSGQRRETD
jgi:regulator of protease activity HflC (stomatin/prohibitin superfamily)